MLLVVCGSRERPKLERGTARARATSRRIDERRRKGMTEGTRVAREGRAKEGRGGDPSS